MRSAQLPCRFFLYGKQITQSVTEENCRGAHDWLNQLSNGSGDSELLKKAVAAVKLAQETSELASKVLMPPKEAMQKAIGLSDLADKEAAEANLAVAAANDNGEIKAAQEKLLSMLSDDVRDEVSKEIKRNPALMLEILQAIASSHDDFMSKLLRLNNWFRSQNKHVSHSKDTFVNIDTIWRLQQIQQNIDYLVRYAPELSHLEQFFGVFGLSQVYVDHILMLSAVPTEDLLNYTRKMFKEVTIYGYFHGPGGDNLGMLVTDEIYNAAGEYLHKIFGDQAIKGLLTEAANVVDDADAVAREATVALSRARIEAQEAAESLEEANTTIKTIMPMQPRNALPNAYAIERRAPKKKAIRELEIRLQAMAEAAVAEKAAITAKQRTMSEVLEANANEFITKAKEVLVNFCPDRSSVAGYSSGDDSSVAEDSSGEGSSMAGCSSGEGSSMAGYSSGEDSSVAGYSSDEDSSVAGCSSSDDSSVAGDSSSDDSSVAGDSSSDDSSVAGCSSGDCDLTEEDLSCSTFLVEDGSSIIIAGKCYNDISPKNIMQILIVLANDEDYIVKEAGGALAPPRQDIAPVASNFNIAVVGKDGSRCDIKSIKFVEGSYDLDVVTTDGLKRLALNPSVDMAGVDNSFDLASRDGVREELDRDGVREELDRNPGFILKMLDKIANPRTKPEDSYFFETIWLDESKAVFSKVDCCLAKRAEELERWSKAAKSNRAVGELKRSPKYVNLSSEPCSSDDEVARPPPGNRM